MEKKIVLLIIALLVVIPVVCCAIPYERRHYGCIQCRLVKRVEFYCGIPITRWIPNVCSRWYTAEYPDHEHEWAKSSCAYSRVAFSQKWSCGLGHNVLHILPQAQKAFIESCTPDEEAQWFELLESCDREDIDKAEEMAADALFGESAR